MPKEWIVLLTFVSIVNSGNAQLLRSLSPKVAYSSSYHEFKYTSPLRTNWERRNGVGIAVAFEWIDLSVLSIITQLEYAQRGVASEFAITSQSSPEIIGYTRKSGHVAYLSIPILFKVSPFSGNISPYLIAGGHVDFMLGHRSDDNILDPVYDKFSKTNHGLSFGVGAALSTLMIFPIVCEVRYDFDLKNSYQTESLTVRNNSITVWLGVAFTT
jgi:hypothetical protein